jgi:spore coat protein U-like protein
MSLSVAQAASAVQAVKAQVIVAPVSACVISVTNMDFGTLSTVLGTETATANVAVRCPVGVRLMVAFLPIAYNPLGNAASSRNSTLTDPLGNKINFGMSLAGWYGIGLGNTPLTTVITGKLLATPNPTPGVYKSTETLYVNY